MKAQVLNATAIVATVHDKRRAKRDGSYPVKLRVTYNRRQVYYPIGIDLSEKDFEKAMGERPRNEAHIMRALFEKYEGKAREIISEIPVFSFETFELRFSSKRTNRNCVFDRYLAFIEEMETEGRVKTAATYRHALQSLQAFHRRDSLPFGDVTVEFLKGFESWMTKPRPRTNGTKTTTRANSLTTVSMYIRTLRTVLNKAIAEKQFSLESYPFGKNGYQVPASQNVKKALSTADLKKLFAYDADPKSPESFYRDLWLFSYLCNGANMKDVARLKYANIEADRVVFIRAKTENTSRKKLKPIVAHLPAEAKAIIEKWGTKPQARDGFVFAILPAEVTPSKEMELIHQMTKQVNKYIGRIAEAVGIEQHVTTYTARHSFATVLKRSNAPISFISEALGHKDMRTTENYLDSFNDDARQQWAGNLTDFL
jgi:integrase/recombinase XerD